jgi:DNA-directed RNA polymerase subunit beta'
LSEDEYLKAQEEFGADSFTAGIGAEAIREMLKALELDKLQADCAPSLPLPIPT